MVYTKRNTQKSQKVFTMYMRRGFLGEEDSSRGIPVRDM
jgi:hypothetical protein